MQTQTHVRAAVAAAIAAHIHTLAQSISICTGNIEFMVLLNDH